MTQPQLNALHPQPRLPQTPDHLRWARLIGVLLMLVVSVLVYLFFPGNISTSSPSAGTRSIDANAAQLYSADADKREQAIASLGLAAQSGSGEAATQLDTFF